MKKNIWVVKHKENWGVRVEGDDQDLQAFGTQKEAIAFAHDRAKQDQVELIVQGEDGAIRQKDSFGHDPRSVRG